MVSEGPHPKNPVIFRKIKLDKQGIGLLIVRHASHRYKKYFFMKPIQWDRPIEPSIQILVRRFVGFTQFTKWDINRHGLEIEV